MREPGRIPDALAACAEAPVREAPVSNPAPVSTVASEVSVAIQAGIPDEAREAAERPSRSAPAVSVLLMTYNHAPFVEQAIASILAQEVEGGYEVLISEDCSTDGTREIVQDLQRRHPHVVRLLLSEQNRNDNEIVARGVRAARGRYVALLDGDDYWTSPRKLQKQVDFLDRHPECAICFHNVAVVYEGDAGAGHPFHLPVPDRRVSAPRPKPISTLEDLLAGNFMQTCSVMFRNGLIREFPDWYRGLPIGDWPLHVLNAEHGSIGYLDEILAAYRVHPAAVWSMNLSLLRDPEAVAGLVLTLETLDRHLHGRYRRILRRRRARLCDRAARMLAKAGRHEEAADYALKSLRASPPRIPLRKRHLLKLVARGRLPRLYALVRRLKAGVARRSATAE